MNTSTTERQEILKDTLMERGLWGAYVEKVDALMVDGSSGRDARLSAIREIADDLAHLVDGRIKKAVVKVVADELAHDESEEMSNESPKKRVGRPSKRFDEAEKAMSRRLASKAVNGHLSADPADYIVDPKVFDGKDCSERAAYKWAYSHRTAPSVKAKDAPSLLAWTIFTDMMTRPQIEVELIKLGLGKLLSANETTEDTSGKFDGQGEYDLLAEIASVGGPTE